MQSGHGPTVATIRIHGGDGVRVVAASRSSLRHCFPFARQGVAEAGRVDGGPGEELRCDSREVGALAAHTLIDVLPQAGLQLEDGEAAVHVGHEQGAARGAAVLAQDVRHLGPSPALHQPQLVVTQAHNLAMARGCGNRRQQ